MLNLKQRLRAEGVFDPEYVCWMVDNAVEWLDGYIESQLAKSDDPQKELETLLDIHEKASPEDAALLLRMQLNAMVGKPMFDRILPNGGGG